MLKKTAIFTILTLILIQFIHVDRTNPKIDKNIELKAPQDVMHILKKSCYDCHSYETKWPYYSNIAPISFVVASHVKDARSAMNFSTWKEIDIKKKAQRLKRAIQTVNNGMMALPSYVYAHKGAKLTKSEKEVLTSWFKQELSLLEKD